MIVRDWHQKQLLYLRSTAYGYWLGSNVPSLVSFLILRQEPLRFLNAWFIATVTASTLSMLWRRHAFTLLEKNKITWNAFNISCFINIAIQGSLWGYISLGVFPDVSLAAQSFICMIVTGVAAGSLTVNASSRTLSHFTLPALVGPLTVGALESGGEYGHMLALAMVVYFVVLLKASHALHKTLKNEFEMALHNHQLRRQLEEKTATLVTQAQHASLGEMAGNMAHEINNPLTTLTANMDLLKMRLDQELVKNSQIDLVLEKMRSNIQRITKIIKGLRHFSRNTSYDEFAPEKINSLFDHTAQLCQERMEAEGIELIVRSCAENLYIDCRGAEICHALLNLINNSRDAIENLEEKWIRLEARELVDALEIRITDSGEGIRPEIQNKIMEPFFTTKEIGKGVGLGLSIAMAIIKAHNGTLELDVESKKTSFVIRLPIQLGQKQSLSQSA